MALTPTTNSRRAPPRRAPLDRTLHAYSTADGAGSFRYGLTARERTAVDRALDIVASVLAGDRWTAAAPDAVKDYLRLQLGGEPVEHFGVLFLDSQHRAIAFERMFSGTLTQTSVYPREIARLALRHHAAAVILTHNHPSGSVQPSRADEALTASVKGALSLVDVRVLDHIIVAPGQALSMAEMGLT
jgi:DNA repair protein RadC